MLAYWHSWLKALVAMGPAIRLTCVICWLNWVYPRRLKGPRMGMSSRATDLVQAHILLHLLLCIYMYLVMLDASSSITTFWSYS